MTNHSSKLRKQKTHSHCQTKTGQNIDIETLIANSMHDLKNSLTILLGQIESLQNDNKSTDNSSTIQLNRLQLEGEHVKASLMHLLTLYRMNRQQYFVNSEEHQINDFFESLRLHYNTMLLSRGLTLEIRCNNNLYWFFDRELIESVFHNLLNNAARHASQTIQLTACIENSYLILRIIDDGPGYPQAMLDNDQPAHSAINYAGANTGLGIYFATQIANMHTNKKRHGFINLANQDAGHGGCFTLCLP